MNGAIWTAIRDGGATVGMIVIVVLFLNLAEKLSVMGDRVATNLATTLTKLETTVEGLARIVEKNTDTTFRSAEQVKELTAVVQRLADSVKR